MRFLFCFVDVFWHAASEVLKYLTAGAPLSIAFQAKAQAINIKTKSSGVQAGCFRMFPACLQGLVGEQLYALPERVGEPDRIR
eukprot:12669073-Alexandrium_andersonii.AAC.1